MAKKRKSQRDLKRQRLLKKLVDDSQRYFSRVGISPTQSELLEDIAEGLADQAGVAAGSIDIEALAEELGWKYSPRD